MSTAKHFTQHRINQHNSISLGNVSTINQINENYLHTSRDNGQDAQVEYEDSWRDFQAKRRRNIQM